MSNFNFSVSLKNSVAFATVASSSFEMTDTQILSALWKDNGIVILPNIKEVIGEEFEDEGVYATLSEALEPETKWVAFIVKAVEDGFELDHQLVIQAKIEAFIRQKEAHPDWDADYNSIRGHLLTDEAAAAVYGREKVVMAINSTYEWMEKLAGRPVDHGTQAIWDTRLAAL